MHKTYILDTNILLEDPNAISILRNGSENKIIIPRVVLLELDNLKKSNKRHLVSKAVKAIEENLCCIEFIETSYSTKTHVDSILLKDISDAKNNCSISRDAILVTNDRLLRCIAKGVCNTEAEPFIKASPILEESELFNGISEEAFPLDNSFVFKNGQPLFFDGDKYLKLGTPEKIWGVLPNSIQQSMACYLFLREQTDIISIQSVAGLGKSYLALACALYLVFEKNKFKNIKIVKPNIEIGREMGFLPGDLDEKMYPFARPMLDLLEKLNEILEKGDSEDG